MKLYILNCTLAVKITILAWKVFYIEAMIKVDTLFKVKVISLIFDYLADTGIA
jgi:hypothetical protein